MFGCAVGGRCDKYESFDITLRLLRKYGPCTRKMPKNVVKGENS
jgi:hypothetical protein